MSTQTDDSVSEPIDYPPELLNRAHARATLRKCGGLDGDIYAFMPTITPKFTAPRHLGPLVDCFHDAEHTAVSACTSVPPRHSKTETILHSLAWFMRRQPHRMHAYVAYNEELAHSKARQLLHYARRAGCNIVRGAVSEMRLAEGGGCFATGIDGGLVGHGVDGVFVIDDPFKNRKTAESPKNREGVWQFFQSVANTRLEPGASILVNHTRWHGDDLIGRLGTNPDYRQINIPAIYLCRTCMSGEFMQTPHGYVCHNGHVAVAPAGQALWPARWPLASLLKKRSNIGEYEWNALYMGTPRPRGAKLFGEPACYFDRDLTGWRLFMACDPAGSERTSADWSAIVIAAVRFTGAFMQVKVLHVERHQISIPDLCDRLLALQLLYNVALICETNNAGKAVPQMLRKVRPKLRIVEVHAVTDKFTRAQPLSAAWNEGRVMVPVAAIWLPDLLHEMSHFTGVSDPQDDQVDALAHLFNYAMTAMTLGTSKASGKREMSDTGAY